jgi:hypothetical protein
VLMELVAVTVAIMVVLVDMDEEDLEHLLF